MTVQAQSGAPAAHATAAEWWQRIGIAWRAWLGSRPGLRRAWRVARWVLLAASVVWIAVLAVTVPGSRGGIGALVGCYWLLLVWFLLARTKTLSWRGYAGLFAVGIWWAAAVGLGSWWLSGQAGGPRASGAVVVLAPTLEETAKLVPLAALAFVAAGRVSRFAVTDWLLAGYAGGLGFTVVEEFARRALPDVSGVSLAADPSWPVYGLSPLSGGSSNSAVATLSLPGHQVLTALIGVSVGLGIACWRRAGSGDRHGLWRAVAIALPVGAWVLAVADHAAWNLAAVVGAIAPASALADALAGWSVVTGHGAGRAGLLAVLLVVAMLVDARRQRSAGETGPLLVGTAWSGTAWAVRWGDRLRERAVAVAGRSTPILGGPVRAVADLCATVLMLVAMGWRDLAVPAALASNAGHASVRDRYPRWCAGLVRVRALREEAQQRAALTGRARHASTLSSARQRVLAFASLVLIAVLIVVTPAAAGLATSGLGSPGDWLGGGLAALPDWWQGLAPWQQALTGGGAIAAGLLPFLSGTSGTSGTDAVAGLTSRLPPGVGGGGLPPGEEPGGAARGPGGESDVGRGTAAGPDNILNADRLAEALRQEELASPFNSDATLKPEVIADSRLIIEGNKLHNPDLIRHLTSNGSSINDWAKYTTGAEWRDGEGRWIEVHSYKNRVTGEVCYDDDYKIKYAGTPRAYKKFGY